MPELFDRGIAYGFNTNEDGSWSAYYGGNAKTGKSDNRVAAIIEASDWLELQKKREGVNTQIVPSNTDRGADLTASVYA